MTNETIKIVVPDPIHHTEVFCPDDWDGPIAAQAARQARITEYENIGGWDISADSYEDSSRTVIGYMFQAWPSGTERPKTPGLADAMRIGPSGVVENEVEAFAPDSRTTYIDNSIICAQAQCSTQAWMRYAMHYTSADEALYFEAGTATHLMLENYFRGVPAADCLTIFDNYYKEWADAKISTLPDRDDGKEHRAKRLTHANVRKILEQWLEVHPLDRLPFVTDPDLVEIGFQYPLNDEGDLVLVGRIDAIVRNLENTAWRILDWKTTANIDYKFMDRINYGSQLTGYIEGAQVCFPEPVEGAMIGAIELGKLPDSNRQCKEHGVKFAECSALHAKFQFIGPLIRSEHEIAAWKQCAASLAKKFQETRDTYTEVGHVHLLQMQGRFNGSCGFCTFRDWCDVGRPTEPQFLDGMLQIEKWEPWKDAFEGKTKPEVKTNGNS